MAKSDYNGTVGTQHVGLVIKGDTMANKKVKVYTYKRVSTSMQVDGYSLDAQNDRMEKYAEFNDMVIAGSYSDEGKSGKNIARRTDFQRMLNDIAAKKDNVKYVLVFKLSRFGRNAADVLNSLQFMQDYGVNLICIEDGIDSSKESGKLMISVLSAVAEIERENILVQTMEGRRQKAREGKWNGGFAPYGYNLEDGKLYINEEEAEAIRIIFDQYIHTGSGSIGIAKYLANHGIQKRPRQNGTNPLFDAALIRNIIKNPVYCGKIAYGRRRTEKVNGTRDEYHLVEKDDYLMVDGLHEAIVSVEDWEKAQIKVKAQAKRYEHVNRATGEKIHMLSGIVRCPICGAGMYGNKSIKKRPDGTNYKDYFYYGCKHRLLTRGHKCTYRNQVNEEVLDKSVAEVVSRLVSRPKFAQLMQDKINTQVDTTAIDQEIKTCEKNLRNNTSLKIKLIEEMDALDFEDKHYDRKKADLDARLDKAYDKIEELEDRLFAAKAKKTAIEAEQVTAENIYRVLRSFNSLYKVMDDEERRRLMEALIAEVQIYEDKKETGQWLKSIKFKLPIVEESVDISLDNQNRVECVTLLQRKNT